MASKVATGGIALLALGVLPADHAGGRCRAVEIPSMLGGTMDGIAKACVGLAVLALLGALVTSFTGPVMELPAEAFSRASTNLALLAPCLFIGFKDAGGAGG
jgi:hypothetical protein